MVTLAAGLALFAFARGGVRGWLGDVLIVVFLDAALASIPLGTAPVRLAAVGALSVGLEALQGLHLVGPGAPWIAHLLLGSTFDPWDLACYAVGLAASAGLERRWVRGPG